VSDEVFAWAVWLLWAPLVEEIVFRLGLHSWLHRRGGWSGRRAAAWGTWPSTSNLLVALAFGVAHGIWRADPMLGVAVVLPAVFLGHIYDRFDRLWPCVVIHALFNLFWVAFVD